MYVVLDPNLKHFEDPENTASRRFISRLNLLPVSADRAPTSWKSGSGWRPRFFITDPGFDYPKLTVKNSYVLIHKHKKFLV